MARLALDDHPERYALTNELHARPFPELTAPCSAIHLAIKQPEGAADRDREADRAHLCALLDRNGAPHPPPGASHWSGPLGRGFLKWELHTEFVDLYALRRRRGRDALLGGAVPALPERLAGGGAGADRHLLPGAGRAARSRRGRAPARGRPAALVRAGEPCGQPGGRWRGADRGGLPHRRERAQPAARLRAAGDRAAAARADRAAAARGADLHRDGAAGAADRPRASRPRWRGSTAS